MDASACLFRGKKTVKILHNPITGIDRLSVKIQKQLNIS